MSVFPWRVVVAGKWQWLIMCNCPEYISITKLIMLIATSKVRATSRKCPGLRVTQMNLYQHPRSPILCHFLWVCLSVCFDCLQNQQGKIWALCYVSHHRHHIHIIFKRVLIIFMHLCHTISWRRVSLFRQVARRMLMNPTREAALAGNKGW
jgi:hypothetical protein